MSTRYRRGTRYKSSVATNSTRQARQDRNGTDQLNMLQESQSVRLTGSGLHKKKEKQNKKDLMQR